MLKDITLRITPEMIRLASEHDSIVLKGHIGTHFDVMNKDFPIEYTERNAYIFDVRGLDHKEIGLEDVDTDKVSEGMFVGFCTGLLDEKGFNSPEYHTEMSYLSVELIDKLLEKKISIIGVDLPGVRKGKEHTPMDQYCADRGVFIVENLCNMSGLCGKDDLVIRTFPVNYAGMSGLPCRVVAEYEK